MRIKDVPQDESILEGHQRACYAIDDNGRYKVVPSKGWEVETIVNGQAVTALREELEDTRRRVLAGLASPLEYHMQRCQMTPAMLAANAGLWAWRVRRHLKPAVFATLNQKLLARYADTLRMTVDDLKRVPIEPVSQSR
jgi:hypothetical protein